MASVHSPIMKLRIISILTLISLGLFIYVIYHYPRHYKNCSVAKAEGRFNISKTDKSYNPKLDLDHDGVACER